MKITMENGFTFEGTQAEYEAFMAFAEAQMGKQEAAQSVDTIEFEGEQYRKVERKAQAGDVVVFRESTSVCAENEIPYKVYPPTKASNGDVTYNHDVFGEFNVHSANFGRTPETVDVYEKVLADASKPKLKAGDFVKFKRSIADTKAGKPYKIEYCEDDGELSFKDDAGDWCDIAVTGEYEIISAEEVAKHADEAKWAKIGRKDDEYKVGDIVEIVRYQYGANVGEIVKIDDVDADGVHYPHHEGATGFGADYDAIKLITPVESTLN